MSLKRLLGPVLILALLITLYIPTFVWLARSWDANPYYGHGLLIPFVSAFFIWKSRNKLNRTDPSSMWAPILVLGLAMYITGFAVAMHFLSAISLLIVCLALTLRFFGTEGARSMMFPICFLLFMIPPPFLSEIGLQLQTVSANGSATIVKAAGMPVVTTGAEISLGESTFVIGLPCSGMHSLISLLALAAVLTYILAGPIYRKVLLFLSALPIAIFANILRIVSLLLVADQFGADAAMGFFHDLSSLLLFFIALACLVLMARLLGLRFRSAESTQSPQGV